MNRQPYILQIRDVAGQERFRSVCPSFYRGVHCCLLTFALDDPDSFKNLSMWRNDVLGHMTTGLQNCPFPFVVIGNKCDVTDKARCVTVDQVRLFCSAHGMKYFETSARDTRNVDIVFAEAAVRARQYRQAQDLCTNQEEPTISGLLKKTAGKTKCC